MKNIVGVTFNNDTNIKYYFVDNLHLKKGVTVIVEDNNIEKFAKVSTEIHPIDVTNLKKELGQVIRIASKNDYNRYLNNRKQASLAFKKCKQLIEKYNLDMNLLEANYTFNQNQLIFTFYSDSRVDFRDLAKELASIYKTRIELYQIGIRDKAKKIGGIGLCGQKLCCSRYMNDFNSVSISMAKNQNLSLNPTKINGACGRLLCCLNYENEVYSECRKNLPKVGDVITTGPNQGKVISVNILKKTYTIETPDKGIVEVNGNN
jgi:cell fate regulator YaaT (PSP1 superfamily)